MKRNKRLMIDRGLLKKEALLMAVLLLRRSRRRRTGTSARPRRSRCAMQWKSGVSMGRRNTAALIDPGEEEDTRRDRVSLDRSDIGIVDDEFVDDEDSD
jgi:hypothetical protein